MRDSTPTRRPYGSGSLRLENGKWRIRYCKDGRRIEQSTGLKDRADAEKLLAERIGEPPKEDPFRRLGIIRTCDDSSQSTVGAIAELVASVDLMNRGFNVYRAVSPNSPCDLIATHRALTVRIEVKATVVRHGKIVSRAPNKRAKGCIDSVALVLRDGQVIYRPPLPEPR